MHASMSIESDFRAKVPAVQLLCITCQAPYQAINTALWEHIQETVENLAATYRINQISQLPAIAASRRAYKAVGKDPARYRLSAEALLRRVVKQRSIYQINSLVDVLNLVSITSGFSIGGYDSEKIEGAIALGIGKKDETYTAIGRGTMNIENLPVLRDDRGAFGSPTSDSERTSVTTGTEHFTMIIMDFGSPLLLAAAGDNAVNWLGKYASATNIKRHTITNE